MSNEKMKKLQSYFDPSYDSDEDLDTDAQKKIQDADRTSGSAAADQVRQSAWNNAGVYPKLKRALKGAWAGDKRQKDE